MYSQPQQARINQVTASVAILEQSRKFELCIEALKIITCELLKIKTRATSTNPS